ncbi:MAG: UPF0147 family protein [Candidatus Diapherotrites archaeon]|nr:UPF0147 family protein [Candidatus Diapherotrites archaeon]
MDEELAYILELMQSITEDTSVPRNIRAVLDESKHKIETSKDTKLAVSSSIYALEDISSDINMPSHTRTEIWTIVSELENVREKIK